MLPVDLFDAEKPARASKSQDPDVGRNFDSTGIARYLDPNSKARQHSPGAFLIPGQVVTVNTNRSGGGGVRTRVPRHFHDGSLRV